MISAIVPLLLEAALRALLAAAAVWAGLHILRIGNVVVQKAAWGLVLVAAVSMPLAPRWQGLPVSAALHLPTIQWGQAPAAAPVAQPAMTPDSAPIVAESAPAVDQSPAIEPSVELKASPQGSDRYPAPSISSADFMAPAQAKPEPAAYMSEPVAAPVSALATTRALSLRPATMAWALYLGVFAALLLRLLVGLASALRLWMTAKPVDSLHDSDPAESLRLRSSKRVASPVNIGSGIILPADFGEWDAEKLRVVLAHERSHVRQGDFYLQLLAGFYASLFWFSPLGWWLKRKLNELSEAISDRAGLEEAASRSSYAQLLLEFAALPRPTLTGVAMARTSHLAQRIERLLNESSFRQAFAAGGRRALLAVLLVPVALVAATALVRVEAAAAPTPQAQAATQQPTAGQSTPEPVTQPAPAADPTPVAVAVPPLAAQETSPVATPAPPPPPAAPGDPGQAPMAPEPPDPPTGAIAPMPPTPPMPPMHVRIDPGDIRVHIDSEIRAEMAAARAEEHAFRGMHFSFDGEPYALVGDPGSKTRFNGEWDSDDNRKEEIEKARKIAHGHFLWFRHDGKSFIVDDPAIVSQIEAMNKPMDDLGEEMRTLGDQMRDLGAKQRAEGQKMRDITIPTPDLSKEMAELNAAVASLKAKQGGTISQKDLGDLQREFGRIQGELGALQGKIGAQQGAFGGEMGKFGGQMGELGGQMGKLGGQMGKIAHENHEKITGIIDETLK
jgi:beta-lactamase regulating signal transducer with metallopeptidase domain